MAQLGINFNPDQIEITEGFEVIPPGWYPVTITKSDVVQNNKGTGKILKLTMQVLQGERAGSTITDNLNIIHQNETAQRIGQSDLAKVCKAVGFSGQLMDTSQLHGRSFEVRVAVEQFESNKEPGKMLDSNKVKDYRAPGAVPQTFGTAAQQNGGQQQRQTAW